MAFEVDFTLWLDDFISLFNRLGASIPTPKSQPTPEPKVETKETSDPGHENTASSKTQEEPSKVESEPESELGK